MSTRVDAKKAPYDTRLDRDTAMALAGQEYARFASAVADLTDDDWRAPTCCPGWTVRDVVGQPGRDHRRPVVHRFPVPRGAAGAGR